MSWFKKTKAIEFDFEFAKIHREISRLFLKLDMQDEKMAKLEDRISRIDAGINVLLDDTSGAIEAKRWSELVSFQSVKTPRNSREK